jgi:pimeloyl-[acyl-carrier protein] methyl ester esterase
MEKRRDILRLLAGLGAAGAAPALGGWRPAAFQSSRITVSVQGRSFGEAPDLVLIPGLASTADVWRGTAAALQDRYRLHLVSVRGFGELPAQANAEGPLLTNLANEIRRYIHEEGLIAPAVIGHSMGGQLGIRVGADAGDGVSRVMTVDSSPFFAALISPQATARDVEPIAQVAYQALQFFGDEALMAQGRRLGVELGGATDALFGTLGWQGGDRRVLAQALYEVMTVDLRPRLADIRAPVTVVYGWSPDEASPRSRADNLFRQAYARLRPPAVFERIEGAEHMVMIDRPTQFLAAMGRFLA